MPLYWINNRFCMLSLIVMKTHNCWYKVILLLCFHIISSCCIMICNKMTSWLLYIIKAWGNINIFLIPVMVHFMILRKF